MIPKMSVFTLAISWLTTSNLPWFMDLTFQVLMHYCSVQHQTIDHQTHPQLGDISTSVHSLHSFWNCFSSNILDTYQGFPLGLASKQPAYNAGDLGPIRGSGRPLEKGMATHSTILAWRISWILAGYSPQDCKKSDMTEQLTPLQTWGSHLPVSYLFAFSYCSRGS